MMVMGKMIMTKHAGSCVLGKTLCRSFREMVACVLMVPVLWLYQDGSPVNTKLASTEMRNFAIGVVYWVNSVFARASGYESELENQGFVSFSGLNHEFVGCSCQVVASFASKNLGWHMPRPSRRSGSRRPRTARYVGSTRPKWKVINQNDTATGSSQNQLWTQDQPSAESANRTFLRISPQTHLVCGNLSNGAFKGAGKSLKTLQCLLHACWTGAATVADAHAKVVGWNAWLYGDGGGDDWRGAAATNRMVDFRCEKIQIWG